MIRKKVNSEQVTVNRSGRLLGGSYALMLALTLLVLLLRIAYVQFWHPYGLAPDEAQYWSWLAHNDWSFLTKPPLTTWLIGISTFVLGDTLLGVKLFALLGQAAVSVLGYTIAQNVAGRAAAWWAWALLTTVPLIAAGGLIMGPDAILLPLWLAALLGVVKALKESGTEEPGTRSDGDARALCWGRWLIIGVLIGVGGLAKYSAAAFYPLLGLFLLVFRRQWLLRPQIWVSGLVALAFQVPVLLWNRHNDWVGLSHVLWQAGGANDGRHGGLATLGEYIGGQALVLGPVVFGLVVVGLYRVMSGDVGLYRKAVKADGAMLARLWLVWVAVAILAALALLSLTTKVQANWPVLGSVVAVIVAAIWLGQRNRGTQEPRNQGLPKWVLWVAGFGVMLNMGLSLVLMDTYKARDMGILPLKAQHDPTKDLRGWGDAGVMLGLMLYKLDNPLVLSSRYQTLAPLMFHTLGNPEFMYVNAEERRLNQYDLWPKPEIQGRLVVYVSEKNVLPEQVRGMFKQCAPWHTLGVEEYGVVVRRLHMWICWGAR